MANRKGNIMKIAVLCDGAGLARLGLEQSGHECTGYELNPHKHYLSTFVGSGNCILADIRDVNLSGYDAVWTSPPCQWNSAAMTQGTPSSKYTSSILLQWCLRLPHDVLWVENVFSHKKGCDAWGRRYNAAQFTEIPLQNRPRLIGGRYNRPYIYRHFKPYYRGVCYTITATEYKGCASDTRRASRFYGRKLTLEECAYHQGFTIPEQWYKVPEGFTKAKWYYNLYEAIGNGVPVYMSKSFGKVYSHE